MPPKRHRFSIVSQPLDRAALLAYLLGGIVPLVGLILVAKRYAAGELLKPALAVGILSISLLSLASFLLLQRTTRQALRSAELDNQRLASLVEASRSFAAPVDRDEVIDMALGSATALTEASAAFFAAPREGVHVVVSAAKGSESDALFQRHSAEIHELAALALPADGSTEDQGIARAEIGGRPALAIGIGEPQDFRGSLVLVQAPQSLHDPAQDGALTALGGVVSVALKNADLRGKQRNFFTHVTNLLVSALDTHLDHQTDHSRRVAMLANRVGRALGLDEPNLQRLHFASLLHDIGMLRIDPASLDGNRLAIETHPSIGFEMLKQIDLWRDVAPLVLHHHERWDGNGYPDQLSGDSIPLESRIIAVAEAFDSMTSSQSYKVVVSESEALGRIRDASGSQFDPQVAEVFLGLHADEGGVGDPTGPLG